MHASPPSPAGSVRSRGTLVVAVMIAAALGLAAFAVWFQWRQTRRCLDFYGGHVARLVQTAPRVELWRLAPAAGPAAPEPRRRIDVSRAPGLVHLRRGLVEDANFTWDAPTEPGQPRAWSLALAFFAEPEPLPAVLVFDTGETPAVAVAGRTGIMVPGPIAAGLRKWLAEADARGTVLDR